MKFLHVGFAVENLDESVKLWQSLGFEVVNKFEKQEPKAHVIVVKDKNGSNLELWEFTDKNHPLQKIIGKHIGLACEDAQADAQKLVDAGFKEVIPFTKGVTVDYLFLQDGFGTNYELTQAKDKHE
jgi:catechol 2,3-dioxygenase-like lactoylglutathione lyase family enzyme